MRGGEGKDEVRGDAFLPEKALRGRPPIDNKLEEALEPAVGDGPHPKNVSECEAGRLQGRQLDHRHHRILRPRPTGAQAVKQVIARPR